ncbi:MAG: inorganic phosphate transporter [Methanolinea sp.]|nr:inorganic phosphate transporter [Methanolinea sp.]
MDPIVLIGIGLALCFAFLNGLNDAANSIAIIVANRALTPGRAVLLAAAGNFLGPFLLTTAIARTIGTGIVESSALTPAILTTALIAATAFVLVATRSGFPVSSTHALVGGLVGAGMAAGGPGIVLFPSTETVAFIIVYAATGAVPGAVLFSAAALRLKEDPRLGALIGGLIGASLTVNLVILTGVVHPTGILAIIVFIVVSPMMGLFCAFILDVAISHLFRYSRQNRMRRVFLPLEVVAGGFQALGHGGNDGQNAIGIITALLVAGGFLSGFTVPFWVLCAGAGAIALGTFFGGWEVIERIARKITKIRPYQGFSAASSAGVILSAHGLSGIPVSSSHVIGGAIVGIGITRGFRAVRWDIVREIAFTWVTTIPIAVMLSYLIFQAFRLAGG